MKKRWIAVIILLCSAIGAMISYRYWDIPLAHYFRGLDKWVTIIFEIITQAGDSLWYFIILIPLFILVRFLWKNEKWSARTLFLLLSISLSGLLNVLLKWIAGRNRPINLFENDSFGFDYFSIVYLHETTSFPSGHTVTAFALATALSFLFPKLSPLAFLAAVTVAVSRVVITAHYLSDVIAGAAVGIICCMGLKYVFDRYHIDLN
ncbi:MAG: phosphatase PAP2 family protein [Smithellaceae bacterium]